MLTEELIVVIEIAVYEFKWKDFLFHWVISVPCMILIMINMNVLWSCCKRILNKSSHNQEIRCLTLPNFQHQLLFVYFFLTFFFWLESYSHLLYSDVSYQEDETDVTIYRLELSPFERKALYKYIENIQILTFKYLDFFL